MRFRAAGRRLVDGVHRVGINLSARRSWVWVFVLSFIWLATTTWTYPLLLPDEGRYVGVAWHMLASGDYLTPRL
ncbi:MAG TPA: hypothetical protein VHK04_01165, partial [Castellaniella sp.]|nr:hypothetical protein [Castellaniella sp.]